MFKHLFASGWLRSFLAVTLATVAFTLWGFLWYATLFDDVWQSLIGRTEEDLLSMAVARGFGQTFFTWFISAVQVSGLFLLIGIAGAKSFWEHQFIAAIVSVMIAVPVLGNVVLFGGASGTLWGLDLVHFILGYAGIVLVIFLVNHVGRKAPAP